jgi:DNA-binding Xre family transcriptional regulator
MDELGIGAKQLSTILGLTRQRVYQMIKGTDTSFHQDTINRLCEALGCKEEDIFEVRPITVQRRVPREVKKN